MVTMLVSEQVQGTECADMAADNLRCTYLHRKGGIVTKLKQETLCKLKKQKNKASPWYLCPHICLKVTLQTSLA